MTRGAIRAPGGPAFVVFDGQSLNLRGSMLFGVDPYPDRLMYGRGLPWANVAVSGESWTDLTVDADTRLHPYGSVSTHTKLVLVLCGGQTDINNEGDSAATIMSDIVAYAQAARTAGFTHVIATTIPGSTTYDAGEETVRTDFNTLLLTDAGSDFDGVADLAATALNDGSDSTYFWDGIHFTEAGAQLCADTVAPVLDTVLAS